MNASAMNYTQSFEDIIKKAESLGITPDQIQNLPSVKSLKARKYGIVHHVILGILVTVFVPLLTALLFEWPMARETLAEYYFDWRNLNIDHESCLIEKPDILMDMARPPVDCSICENVKTIDRVTNITPEHFEEVYAYSGRPVVILDGMRNWTASDVFSVEFFKNIYPEDSPVMQGTESSCQFFNWGVSVNSLSEAFNITLDGERPADGSPWYFGWSNCDSTAAGVLRQHYSRPYFLPSISYSSKTDWIFLGSPGYGAPMHIDNVKNPSWQAQVRGTKLWMIEPAAECYHVCGMEKREILVEPGHIFVVDTNVWYHSTKVQGEEISICIGSEFD